MNCVMISNNFIELSENDNLAINGGIDFISLTFNTITLTASPIGTIICSAGALATFCAGNPSAATEFVGGAIVCGILDYDSTVRCYNNIMDCKS